MAVAGAIPAVMGIGPCRRTNKALERAGLKLATRFDRDQRAFGPDTGGDQAAQADLEKDELRRRALAIGHPLVGAGRASLRPDSCDADARRGSVCDDVHRSGAGDCDDF